MVQTWVLYYHWLKANAYVYVPHFVYLLHCRVYSDLIVCALFSLTVPASTLQFIAFLCIWIFIFDMEIDRPEDSM